MKPHAQLHISIQCDNQNHIYMETWHKGQIQLLTQALKKLINDKPELRPIFQQAIKDD